VNRTGAAVPARSLADMVDRTVRLAADAYIFGYPLVYGIDQIRQLRSPGPDGRYRVPANAFVHADRLAGPSTSFVSVNNDTLYSMAYLDMSGGPLRLDVPEADGRYYVLQVVDAWTNPVAYVGTRATGTAPGSYLLVPPGWAGRPPEGTVVISVPTAIAVIVGRTGCDGPDDLPRVRAFQRGLRLTAEPGNGPLAGIPEVPDGEGPLGFLARLHTWTAAFPPGPSDRAYAARFDVMPLTDPTAFDALAAGLADGRRELETLSRDGTTPPVDGWHGALHLFDYNIDFLGIGTRDDPRWRIEDRFTAYPVRALAARVGLWGNHAYEAAYSTVNTDADGAPLTGAHRYRLRLDRLPPVSAFWSLTMYDTPEYHLVANEIDRYSIGDRTPGLRRDPDGSLTVLLGAERPDGPDAVNWLPAPPGEFRPMMRMYLPGDEILDGRYHLPPVERLD
jgi:hypothetical protein